MTKREALAKLKKFWTEHEGSDYLLGLLQIKKDLPKGHRSAKSLEEEIREVESAYPDFLLWKESSTAKRKSSTAKRKRKTK